MRLFWWHRLPHGDYDVSQLKAPLSFCDSSHTSRVRRSWDYCVVPVLVVFLLLLGGFLAVVRHG